MKIFTTPKDCEIMQRNEEMAVNARIPAVEKKAEEVQPQTPKADGKKKKSQKKV